MIQSILREIELRSSYLKGQTLETIYFGGGTPGILEANELERIMGHVHTHFAIAPHPEVTLEANPDDINIGILELWRNLGINRLSLGIQSFNDDDLRWMNRAHDAAKAEDALRLAIRSGFTNISADLIYGLPDQSEKDWERNIAKLLQFDVPHVSAYCLTVEKKTALHAFVKQGRLIPAGEELQRNQFIRLIALLEQMGLEQYEISNFARPGMESKHNSAYWNGANYLGIGPSAHSFNGLERSWNVANNQKYMRLVTVGGGFSESEELSERDRFNELLLTGLRTRNGVDLDTLTSSIAPATSFFTILEAHEKNGLLTIDAQRVRLTLEGKLQADYIAASLFQIE